MDYLILPQVTTQQEQDEKTAALILMREHEYADYTRELEEVQHQLDNKDLMPEVRAKLEEKRDAILVQRNFVETSRAAALEQLPTGARRTAAISAVVNKEITRKQQGEL